MSAGHFSTLHSCRTFSGLLKRFTLSGRYAKTAGCAQDRPGDGAPRRWFCIKENVKYNDYFAMDFEFVILLTSAVLVILVW